MQKTKNVWKTVIFILILGLLLAGANYLFKPVMLNWNNYSTLEGFYGEPENTIETIFLGSSRTICAFDPMQAYRDYGICSYNLGSMSQPIFASYYRTVEAYRCHSETLKTVVLECMGMRDERPFGRYQIAIDNLHYPTKYYAVKNYPVEQKEKFYYFLPLLEYHNKWSALTREDFEKISYEPVSSTRGYLYKGDNFFDYRSYDKVPVASAVLDEDAAPTKLNEEGLVYFKKLVKFCEDKGLKLVLTSTVNRWTSADHNAIAELAEKYGLDYIDFNFGSAFDELDFNLALDMYAKNHANYYGASKMTAWFGEYLTRECGATDVRGDADFAYMEEELEEYRTIVENVVELKETADLCEYLKLAGSNPDYTVMIAARGNAVSGLDEKAKKELSSMGLAGIQKLRDGEAYLAVIDGGKVSFEQLETEDAGTADALVYEGALRSGGTFTLKSGGAKAGNTVSCVIDETEYFPDSRGMNIVVYDNLAGEDHAGTVIDSTVFDTGVSSVREAGYMADLLARAQSEGTAYKDLPSDLKELYLYNRRCERIRKGNQG